MNKLNPTVVFAACSLFFTLHSHAGVTFTAPAKPAAKPPAAAVLPAAKPAAATPAATTIAVEPVKPKNTEPTKPKLAKETDSVDGGKPKPSTNRKPQAKATPVVVSQVSIDYMREMTAALTAGTVK